MSSSRPLQGGLYAVTLSGRGEEHQDNSLSAFIVQVEIDGRHFYFLLVRAILIYTCDISGGNGTEDYTLPLRTHIVPPTNESESFQTINTECKNCKLICELVSIFLDLLYNFVSPLDKSG